VSYLLDTTVVIDHVRGYPPGVELVEWLFSVPGDLYTCDVVSCEALSRGDAEEQEAVRRFLDALEFVAVDPDAARWAGHQRRELLEREARKPAVGDALIAGLAWRLGATVVTRNSRDFEPFGVPVLGYDRPLP
jgi:predicted nucleic acid-binding protein